MSAEAIGGPLSDTANRIGRLRDLLPQGPVASSFTEGHLDGQWPGELPEHLTLAGSRLSSGRASVHYSCGLMALDGFLSYSHAVAPDIGAHLQRGVERIGKKWYRRRALRLFRDDATLGATPDLWDSITEALRESRWFVLLASTEAARSEWVNREIAYWRNLADKADRILIVLLDGDLNWRDDLGRFDAESSTALPPAMVDAFAAEPKHVDLRWAVTEPAVDYQDTLPFRSAVADIASIIRDVPKDELEGEDFRQHRRATRIRSATILLLSLLALILVLVSIQATRESQRADEQARLATAEADRADKQAELATDEALRADEQALQATSRSLAAQSQLASVQDPMLGLVLAVESRAITEVDSVETSRALVVARQAAAETYLQGIGPPVALHDSGITSLAFDSDLTVLTTSWDGTWKAFDIATRSGIGSVENGQGGGVLAGAISATRAVYVTGTESGVVGLWDLSSRTPVHLLDTEDRDVGSAAFDRSGRRLVTGSVSGVRLWDLSTDPVTNVQLHDYWVTDVALTGSEVVASDLDGNLLFWDVGTGALLREVDTGHRPDREDPLGENTGISTMALDSAGTLYTAGHDGLIRAWKGGGATMTLEILAHRAVDAMALHPSGELLATGGRFGSIRLWRTSDGQEVGWPVDGPTSTLAFTPDGGHLIAGGSQGQVQVFSVHEGTEVARDYLVGPSEGELYDVEVSETARVVDAAFSDALRTIDISAGAAGGGDDLTGDVMASATGAADVLAISADGRFLVVGSKDGLVVVNRDESRVEAEVAQDQFRFQDVAVSSGGDLVAMSYGPDVALVDLTADEPTAEVLVSYESEPGGNVAFVAGRGFEGELLVIGEYNGSVSFWDTTTRQLLGRRMGVHPGGTDLLTASDGDHVLFSLGSGDLAFWDLSEFVVTRTVPVDAVDGWGADLSNSGDVIAIVGSDDTVTLIDSATGGRIGAPFEAPLLPKAGVDFGDRDTIFVTGGTGGLVRVWDVLDEEAACAIAAPFVTRAQLEAALSSDPHPDGCGPLLK